MSGGQVFAHAGIGAATALVASVLGATFWQAMAVAVAVAVVLALNEMGRGR